VYVSNCTDQMSMWINLLKNFKKSENNNVGMSYCLIAALKSLNNFKSSERGWCYKCVFMCVFWTGSIDNKKLRFVTDNLTVALTVEHPSLRGEKSNISRTTM
jgi:hypothetical protein